MKLAELEGNQRLVIDVLLARRGKGMTPPELATTLHMNVSVVTVNLKKLRGRGFAMKDPDRSQRDGSPVWMVDTLGIQQLSDRFKKKKRKCLRCAEMFDSEHAGNRICPKCVRREEDAEKREGDVA